MARIGRQDVRFLVLEGIMVLFGVLAALFVDEWRQERELRAEARAAMESVVVEVRENLEELQALDSVVTRRMELLDALQPELDGTTPLASLAGRFRGYRTPELSENAWQRLTAGRAADHVPGAFLQDGFAVYTFNAKFSRLEDEVTRLVFSEVNFDPGRVRTAWSIARGIMDQQVAWAGVSTERYQAFLERWDAGG